MARPREYADRVTTAIRFEPQLHEVIKETADDLGVSVNWLVTRLVTEGLERMGDKFALIGAPQPGSSALEEGRG